MTVVPPVALTVFWYGRQISKLSKKTQDELSEASKVAEEKIGNIRTVRSFANESIEVQRLRVTKC
jgi:ABC-type multidrug transport system fused ATPase/permease subunit